MPLGDDVDLGKISQQTYGFVGADLAALAREAGIRALRRKLPDFDLEKDELTEEELEQLLVEPRDFRDALRDVGPSAMREVMLEVSHVTWTDVGGLDEAKEEVREAVEYPLTDHERFDQLGIRPPRGVLLYGPPGTGKTLIAKAAASESGANFIPIRGPQLLSKWVGESERAVREVFRRARQVAPSIIFFDELDALAPSRGTEAGTHVIESVLNQILTEMDGLEDLKDVVVMGATNRPDIVDPALLRAGRFDRLVYIGEPGREDRRRILEIHTRGKPLEGSAMEEVLGMTGGYGAPELERFVAALGTGRTFTVDEARDADRDVRTFMEEARNTAGQGDAPSDGGMPAYERRQELARSLAEAGLVLKDPARDQILEDLAARAEGYVGSDLEALAREAGMYALRARAPVIARKDFEEALAKVHPTMNENLRTYYGKIQQHFKGGLPKEAQPPEYQ
jgi:transitional endoplasmic reticulum ATPase